MDVQHIMNCNKIKQMKITVDNVADAIQDSTQVELSKDHKKIRRIGNPPLPKKEEKKRDAKAKDKQDVKNAKNEDEKAEESDVEKDEKGNIVLTNADFENP